jgi:DNA-binding NtrC family response regulator
VPLALLFLDQFNRKFGRDVGPYTPEAIAALEAAPWAGNVRELQNVVERTVAIKPAEPISPAGLGNLGAESAAATTGALPYREARDEFEQQYFVRLLDRAGGNVSEASRLSGLARSNFYNHVERLGLVVKS